MIELLESDDRDIRSNPMPCSYAFVQRYHSVQKQTSPCASVKSFLCEGEILATTDSGPPPTSQLTNHDYIEFLCMALQRRSHASAEFQGIRHAKSKMY